MPESTTNNERGPAFKNFNLRLYKDLPYFGDKVRVTVFSEIFNVFNWTNYSIDYLNPTTGEAGIDAYILAEAFNDRPDFRSSGGEKVNQVSRADRIEELSGDDAENLVEIQDINGDGFITKNEITALKLATMLATLDDPRAYLRPREVHLGVKVDF